MAGGLVVGRHEGGSGVTGQALAANLAAGSSSAESPAAAARSARNAAPVPAPPITPARLTVRQDEQTLTIAWADGHEVDYSFEGLRRACPCAACRGGHGRMAEPVDPAVWTLPSLQTYELKEVRPAGNYAVQLVWGDGHSTGIWSWRYLRELGPSAEG